MENIQTAQVTEPHSQFKKSGRGPRGPFAFLFITLVLVDQVAKYFAGDIFRNYKFAFSLPVPLWLVYPVYAVVLGVIVWYIIKNHKSFSRTVLLAWVLIFSGAVANVGERIILGYVRDFIHITFYHWVGIYNLADGYILLGILVLLFLSKKNYSN